MKTNLREETLAELLAVCKKISEENVRGLSAKILAGIPSAETVELDAEMQREIIEDISDQSQLLKKLIPVLLKIFLVTCIFFSIYEVAKQIVFTNIAIWQSHIITIIFAGFVAAFGAYFPLKRIEILYQKSINELVARKKAQAILRESEERYRQLFEMESDALFLIDEQSDQILETNAASTRLYGYAREDLLKMKGNDIVEKKTAATVKEKAKFEQQTEFVFHRRKDGTVFPVEIASSQMTWYGRKVRLSSVREITERLNAQKKIESQRAFLKKVIDANPNFIYVKDKENRIVLANRVLADIFRITPEEMTGKSVSELSAHSDFAEIIHRDDISTLSFEKDRIEREESFTDADGQRRWIFTIKVPMKDEEGRADQMIGVSIDITERKHAEDVLKKRETELEVKSRNLEELNAALKVLLRQREDDKKEIEEMFLSNVKGLVMPYVEKLKNSSLAAEQNAYVATIEEHLHDIISPFLTSIKSKYINLTPKEIQVVSLIKDGKSTKEIADLLNISMGSVDIHRNHIRRKLGINNKNVNLRSYLLSMP